MVVDDGPSAGEGHAQGFEALESGLGRKTGRLRTQGADIHFEVCGQGPVIVFAHGLGGSHLSWWQQVAHFSRHYQCVTFSHRGFSGSSVDAGQPDPAHFADDLQALMAHLRISQAHLVGQSMGGWTVVEYTLRYPQSVASLTLSSTTGSIDPSSSASFDHVAFKHWGVEAANAAQQCRQSGVHPAAGLRMAREQPALHLLYRKMDELSPELDKEALRSRLRAMRVRAPQALAAVRLPVLLISPQEDIVIPPQALVSLSREVEGARLVEMPGTGHSPYFEAAQAFNAHLEAFFLGLDREAQQARPGLQAGVAHRPSTRSIP